MISVLLIDHALENPRSIRKLLALSGNDFKLTCVNTYRKILEGFRSKTDDVCLIDSAADNGLKLFLQARSLGYTAPTVMVTSNDAHEVIRAIRNGVADCLIRDDLSAARMNIQSIPSLSSGEAFLYSINVNAAISRYSTIRMESSIRTISKAISPQ